MDMQTELTRPVRLVEAQRPSAPAPPADAPYDVRAAWSSDYVSWYIAHTPQDGALPSDVRPTHRFEIEFDACVHDPQAYERDTQAEHRQRKLS